MRDGGDNSQIYSADSGYNMKTEGGQDLFIPAHVDTTITLLATYSNGGLQVENKAQRKQAGFRYEQAFNIKKPKMPVYNRSCITFVIGSSDFTL